MPNLYTSQSGTKRYTKESLLVFRASTHLSLNLAYSYNSTQTDETILVLFIRSIPLSRVQSVKIYDHIDIVFMKSKGIKSSQSLTRQLNGIFPCNLIHDPQHTLDRMLFCNIVRAYRDKDLSHFYLEIILG
jgi:hypothetical protein